MNSDYLDRLTTVLEQAHPQFVATNELAYKKVFGAVGGYIDNTIFISCGHFGIALRLPSHVLDELFHEQDVTRLKYFPKGHIKKEYAVLPQRILDDRERFKALLDISINYVSNL